MQRQDSTGPNVVSVPLYGRDGTIRAHTLVDAADVPLLGSAHWRALRVGPGRYYAYRNVGPRRTGSVLLLHRVVLGLPAGRDGREGDHINRDSLDNRRSNLRVVSHAGNMQNRPSHKGSASRYRGVYWDKAQQRWRAQITVDGRRIRLGRFRDEEAAAEAAREARSRLMPYATD